jgi:predicted transcriptional regulator of viral defense system
MQALKENSVSLFSGFNLKRNFNGKMADSLWKALNERTCFPVPLSPQKEKKGKTDGKWKIIINTEIERDL